MLTADEIIGLVRARPDGGRRGMIEALQRRGRRPGQAPLPDSHRALLAALHAEQPDRPPADPAGRPPASAQRHPGAVAQDRAIPRGQQPARLTAAELDWIRQLPAAEQISHDDAVLLARLVLSTPRDSADRRIVETVWGPVAAVFDRRVNEASLAGLPAATPQIPEREVLAALSDTIRAELGTQPAGAGQLSPEEVTARARNVLDGAIADSTAEHAERVTSIQARTTVLADPTPVRGTRGLDEAQRRFGSSARTAGTS